jgi:predicted tellurium resistance membrane protein TerC
MEFLGFLARGLLLMIGLAMIASGLFCGFVGFSSKSGIIIALIGLGSAGIGLIAVTMAIGKRRKEAEDVPPDDPATGAGE